MKTILKYFKYTTITAFVFLLSLPVLAANSFQEGLTQAGAETGYTASNSFFTPDNLPGALGRFIGIFYLGVISIAFMILMIYGGITWMSARGNEEEIQKAKTILKNAIIGIIIAFMVYAIGWFIFTISGLLYKVENVPVP